MKLADFVPVPIPEANLPEMVYIDAGLRTEVIELSAPHVGNTPAVIADAHTWSASGIEPKPTHLTCLTGHVHADDETVDRMTHLIGDQAGAIAVGSGTINDVIKRAGELMGKPYTVFGTAASMNGYASGIAAILSGGLKTTVPARPARAIILDTEVLAAAPAELTQAGLGDLMSKPVSDSDWWLANALEDSGYSTLPSEIVDHAVQEAIIAAPGLSQRDADAHGALGKALVLSGVAMVVAGSSSPASGGEHLISHLWDMEAHQEGRDVRLHGAQVGVATCISAALYQTIIETRSPDFVAPLPWQKEKERIENDHGVLAPIILEQARRKHSRAEARVACLRDRWSEIRDGLAARNLPSVDDIRRPLLQAGAPSRFKDLNESAQNGARVFRLARDIRDRITVLDLAFDLGILPGRLDEVLQRAGV